jgi:predicted kinase
MKCMLIMIPIDNTNADPETRAVWVKLAQKLNVPLRCVLFTASARLCEHNDTVRALNPGPEVSIPFRVTRAEARESIRLLSTGACRNR